jgi:protein-disulfide isomerase
MTPDPRRRRLVLLAAAAAVAALAVVTAIVVSSSGDNTGTPHQRGAPLTGVGEVRALLHGIPQSGVTLGRTSAPVRIVEFGDMQCPFCAQASRDEVAKLIRDYVRPGKARLEFRDMAFLGAHSVRAAQVGAAAAVANHLWQYVELFYANQGAENSGYVTDGFLRDVLKGAGLVPAEVLAGTSDDRARRILAQAQQLARRYRIQSTPMFVVVATGGAPRTVDAAGVVDAVARAAR